MTLLVVGSVAYDSVQTPQGAREDSLGGSATYFSIASSYFSPVSLVAIVGEDFKPEHIALLEKHDVDVSGLERVGGDTFRWSGVYSTEDVNQRETLDTQLNVFADFKPNLSEQHRNADFLFLANIDPELQLEVLGQMNQRPKLVALDSMNFWIDGKKNELDKIVEAVDMVFMDEGEVRTYANEPNLRRAAARIHEVGPTTVVIKRGEHGVLISNEGNLFSAPAFPLDRVVDPTGAGDTFAGGFVGLISATGDLSESGIRRAAVLGSVMGSFTVEDFSANRLAALTHEQVVERFSEFERLTQFTGFDKSNSLLWRA
ncbi:MAG: sugar kinase [Chloroflexi bacterium]|nr:sugar kinase [Chloroflexota bacterium]